MATLSPVPVRLGAGFALQRVQRLPKLPQLGSVRIQPLQRGNYRHEVTLGESAEDAQGWDRDRAAVGVGIDLEAGNAFCESGHGAIMPFDAVS